MLVELGLTLASSKRQKGDALPQSGPHCVCEPSSSELAGISHLLLLQVTQKWGNLCCLGRDYSEYDRIASHQLLDAQ